MADYSNDAAYSTSYAYDKNGNISHLSRNGIVNEIVGEIDDLFYAYNGNQLTRVTDFATGNYNQFGFDENGETNTIDYDYDANGNMTLDENKGISSISYNHLNLPTKINIERDESKQIKYIYTATGNKLRKQTIGNAAENITTDYVGVFVYETTDDLELQFIQTSEGRIVPNENGGFDYEYALQDHLGNTRVMLSQSGEVLQDQSYYPFGLSMGAELSFENNLSSPKNNYLYNSKELQMDFDLGWYDYGARFYDPALGRWHVIDPLSEKYYSNSPYNYVLNRPLIDIDPDGMRFKCYEIDESGMGNSGIKPDVYITGPEAKQATKQLNKSTKMKITRNKSTGKISAKGKPRNDGDRQLLEATNSSNIVVKVKATNNEKTSNDKDYFGGAFMGTEFKKSSSSEGNSVIANQEVNPKITGTMSNYFGKPGADMKHEVTEAYEAGKLSLEEEKSSGPNGTDGSVYEAAHEAATDPSGTVYADIPRALPGQETSKSSATKFFVQKAGAERLIIKIKKE